MKNKWGYILLFALMVCAVVYISIPSDDTLIEMSRKVGNPFRVRQLLQRRFEQEPTNVKIALELARVARQLGDRRTELETLRVANRRRPDDPGVRRTLAVTLMEVGQVEEALGILPLAERDRDFLLLLSNYYEVAGNLDQAEEALLAAERSNTGKLSLWLTLAKWRAQQYDFDGEAEALKRAIDIDPENHEAWDRYLTNRIWRLDVVEAVRAAIALDAFSLLDRGRLEALFNLRLANGDISGAVSTLDKIIALPEVELSAKLRFALMLYYNGATERIVRPLFHLLTLPDGLTVREASEAMGVLRDFALASNNLELARRLAALPADPNAGSANLLAVVEIAIAASRVEEIRDYFHEILADPAAPAEVIVAGMNLAYRNAEYASFPVLAKRLSQAPNPGGIDVSIDGIIYAATENDQPMDFWQTETRRRPDSVQVWVCLAKAAVRQGNAIEARRAVDAALPLIDDRDFINSFSLMESILYLANMEPEGSQGQDVRFGQAKDLADRQLAGPLEGSRWFLLMAAYLNERLGRMELAESMYRRVAEEYPDDMTGWLGIARSAAARGDEATVADVIRRFESANASAAALSLPDTPDNRQGRAMDVRTLVYSCLALYDYLALIDNADPARSELWLDKAGKLMRDHESILPESELVNLALYAEIAMRGGEWLRSYECWRIISRTTPENVVAWLGMARAASAMENPDAAWEALSQIFKLEVSGLDTQLQISWQVLAATAELPEDHPDRAVRRAFAENYAAERLQRQWEPDLAAALVFRSLENDDPVKAKTFLGRTAGAPPEVHAALAEAFLATSLLEQSKASVRVTEFREQALAEAIDAMNSRDKSILMRMTYVLAELNEKDRLRKLLAGIEAMPGEENPEHLRQLADAYGFLEEYHRQFELIERRARQGGVSEWLDAIDRHAWAGDYAGGHRLLAEAEELFPDSLELLDRHLAFLGDNNRPGQVIEVYGRAKNRNPEIEGKLSADALAAVGVAYDDLRQASLAIRFFRMSLEKAPGNKRGSMGQARLFRRDGNMSGAIRVLRRYVDGTPDDPWGWLELANTRADVNQVGRAEYIKVVELTEPDAGGDIPTDVRAARAVALRRLGKEKEALKLLESTVGPVITNPDVACDYAQMLMEIYRYDEAEGILRRTVKVFPYHVWAYRLESTILVRRRKYDLAVARLKEALIWSPNDGEVQRDLGFAAQLWERTWKSQKGWLTAGGR